MSQKIDCATRWLFLWLPRALGGQAYILLFPASIARWRSIFGQIRIGSKLNISCKVFLCFFNVLYRLLSIIHPISNFVNYVDFFFIFFSIICLTYSFVIPKVSPISSRVLPFFRSSKIFLFLCFFRSLILFS